MESTPLKPDRRRHNHHLPLGMFICMPHKMSGQNLDLRDPERWSVGIVACEQALCLGKNSEERD